MEIQEVRGCRVESAVRVVINDAQFDEYVEGGSDELV